MINPKKILDLVQDAHLSFLLGSAVQNIFKASGGELSDEGYIQCLKNARDYLTIEIKRVSRKPKKSE